ncbi:cupin domain-containing protein [Lapidilactobacillus achengensis]|uniref:Cupin domain-containing protein n=1 Tax=Lapidilactobacillus achengensis TaxID=2486000 RepID=A0ABW1UR04_9LACO|nr:cupin domain-containing protein [Lapidilactobacillus achengensis]
MSLINKIPAEKVLDLRQEVPIEPEQMLSKTLVQRDSLGITVFALDQGQTIQRHQTNGDALVNLLSGVAKITIGSQDYLVHAGESLLMPQGIPHELHAQEAFQMLLVVVKPEGAQA